MTSIILIPLVGISPEIFPEANNLSKISWTAVSTDSHSTFVITSNVECITTTSWCLEVIQSTCMRQWSNDNKSIQTKFLSIVIFFETLLDRLKSHLHDSRQ